MKVTVFGIGYVGLVQAAVLADAGHEVCCVDVDESKISGLKKGVIPIFEPGLAALVENGYESGRLLFTSKPEEGVAHSPLQFIAVGTPPDEDGSADTQYVLAVAKTIAEYMDESKIIINKSTVPVGTADAVSGIVSSTLAQRVSNLSFHVVSNPEFLKEGAAVTDCMRPDRIIIGSTDPDVKSVMRELYAPFNRNHDRILFMDVRSAELTKYAANCMLATKISFMNEISCIAEALGADIENVRRGIGSDERIGYHFIYAGCGYGGSCFPKDVKALTHTADQIDVDAQLLKSVESVNARQKKLLHERVERYFKGNVVGKTFAIWGLAFKPKTDDMREATSRVLIEALWQAGASVRCYDPEAMEEAQRIYGCRDDLELVGTKEAALQGADALIICTEWKAFWAPNFELIKGALTHPVIFDGRNIYEPERVESHGLEYYGIGRGRSIERSVI